MIKVSKFVQNARENYTSIEATLDDRNFFSLVEQGIVPFEKMLSRITKRINEVGEKSC